MKENSPGESWSIPVVVRIAAYPKSGKPDVALVKTSSVREATEEAFRLTLRKVEELGGFVPKEAVRELIDNLVHAGFSGAVISILDEGDTVRVSDKGPGVEDKDRAFEFGYSGATPEVLENIRGAGGGLGIARAVAERVGGTVFLDDNIGGGTVAVVSVAKNPMPSHLEVELPSSNALTVRQRLILMAVFEVGIAGPSAVAQRIGTSTSTAYRDLRTLEAERLVVQDIDLMPGKYRATVAGEELAKETAGMRGAGSYESYKKVSKLLDISFDKYQDLKQRTASIERESELES